MLLEILITVIVIAAMLLFIGIPFEGIMNLLLLAVLAGFALTTGFVILFFFGTDIFLLFFRKARGSFDRIDDSGRFDHAVYTIDGEEYRCVFPAETSWQNKIYRKGNHFLLIPKIKKWNIAYDRHSLMIILIGNLFSVILVVLLLLFRLRLMQ